MAHDRKPKIPQKRSRIYDPFQMGNETRQNPKSSLLVSAVRKLRINDIEKRIFKGLQGMHGAR
jgi:hypothetical protein